jgi:RNA polymerase sigma factor (sigma-70 family)
MSKDYFVTIIIKNGPMKRLMDKNGFKTAADLARASGVSYCTVCDYLSLRKKAMNHDGDWSGSIIKLSAALKCMPEEMFPPQHTKYALRKNRSSVYVNIQDISQVTSSLRTVSLPADEVIMKREASEAIKNVLSQLTATEQDILSRRFGLDGPEQTLDEVAKAYKITRERVRQKEAKAIRVLRHPRHSDVISPYIKQVIEN